MASTINALNKPIVIMNFTGFFPFYSQIGDYRVEQKENFYKFLSLIIFLINQCGFAFLLYAAITDYSNFFSQEIDIEDNLTTESANRVFETILCISVSSIMQILCVINYSKFLSTLNAILQIDFELKQKFQRQINSNKIKTFNTVVLIYTIGYLILMLCFVKYSNGIYGQYNLVITSVYLFLLILSTSYVLFFTSLVKIIVTRLRVVNNLFKTVSEKPDEDFKSFFKVVEIYKLVEKTFGLIDGCNGLVLLFYFGFTFYTLTNQIYTLAYKNLTGNGEGWYSIGNIIWIVHHIWILWIVTMNCGNVPSEANKTAQILSRVYGKGKDYQNMIDKFLTKSIKQEIKFTAYGFFVIDNSTLFKIVSAVTTYLVILIQFKQLEGSKSN